MSEYEVFELLLSLMTAWYFFIPLLVPVVEGVCWQHSHLEVSAGEPEHEPDDVLQPEKISKLTLVCLDPSLLALAVRHRLRLRLV